METMPKKSMAALVHHKLEEGAVELRAVPYPDALADDEVLLASRAVGVCGSDVHQYHNTQSWHVEVPVILGHEFCGVVAVVPKGVTGFKEGDRVTSETAARICGQCVYCRTGQYNLCPRRRGFGYGLNGAMAEFVKVPARCLHHLPDVVTFEKAALIEPCCVAYNATCIKAGVRPGDTVLILGPGPIGLLSLCFSKLSGASWVGVAGLKKDQQRLALAKTLGADDALDGGEAATLESLRSLGDGLGVDVVIDASGSSSSLLLAMGVVRPAGQIIKVGWGPQPLGFSLDPLVQKAVRLQGSFSHNFPMWERVIALIASGKIDPTALVDRVEPLANWRICFDEMASGKAVKDVLVPPHS
jgi:L-iditol 2-dehydrogenase